MALIINKTSSSVVKDLTQRMFVSPPYLRGESFRGPGPRISDLGYVPKTNLKLTSPTATSLFKDKSIGEVFGESFRRGILRTGSAIETILSVGAKKIGLEQLSIKLDTLSKQDSELAKVGINITDTRKFTDKMKDPKWIAQGIGETLPTLLFGIGVALPAVAVSAPAVAVGAAAFTGTAALEAGFAYQDAKEFGTDDPTAEKVMGIVGIANGLLEAIPITKLLTRSPFGKQLKRSIIKAITRRVVTQATLESGTESLQEIVSNSVATVYDENRDLLQGVPESAFFGGILGGGVSLGFDVVTNEAAAEFLGKKVGLTIEDVSKRKPGLNIPVGGVELSIIEEAQQHSTALKFLKENRVDVPVAELAIPEGAFTGRPSRAVGPVEVNFEIDTKKLTLTDGVHRVVEAKSRNETLITARVSPVRDGKPVFTEFYNRAVAESEITELQKFSDLIAKENNFSAPKVKFGDVKAYAEYFPKKNEIVLNKEMIDLAYEGKQMEGYYKEVAHELAHVTEGKVIGRPTTGSFAERVRSYEKKAMEFLKPTPTTVRVEKVPKRKVSISRETMAKAKKIYDGKVAKIKDSKEILQRRRSFIKAVQKQFGLSDADLKSITKRDIRLMSNVEFKGFLDDVRTKSEQLAERQQAKSELMAQIQEKELDIEPLRKAMKLPTIGNMTTSQLREFDRTLEPYQKDDVFLSQRKLETIDRTELDGVKTWREVRERLAEKLGVEVKDLNNIRISEFDRFRGEAGLAEQNLFFRMMVEETGRLRIIKETEYLNIEKETFKLAKKIKTTFLQKIIPQQKKIAQWFEAENKTEVDLTENEMKLVELMQGEWTKARDYLVKMKAMDKGMKAENYFTHIRRGILEAIKEDGVIQAVKEVFDQYKLDEQNFDILDTRTGEVLAMDKFFRFALRRTGQLIPTQNITKAFLTYMRTFKKKQALDEIVPLIDIYAHSLTPKGLTKTGLLLHGSLIRFTREWLNTQKGRRVTLVAKQGGKIDWGLRAMRTFTTLLDLGFNLPVTIATQVGEQVITYQLLGKKGYVLGKFRALTPQGKRIAKRYRSFIGKNPWGELIEPAKEIGDRFQESIFVMFRDANVRRNRNFLLGSMTKEEFKNGELETGRLKRLRIEEARYGVVDGAKSIIGATPEAGVFTQYKTWALPILGSMTRNMVYLSKYVATLGKKEQVRGRRAALEFYRMSELLAFVFMVKWLATPDDDDDSMIGKLRRRAYMEATTIIQAIEPALFLGIPRLISFVNDFSKNLQTLYRLEKYEVSKFGEYETGELKGWKKLQKQFTPRAIRQFEKPAKKTMEDVRQEIIEDIKSGTLSVSAAKEKFAQEAKKLEAAEKEDRFDLTLGEYKGRLSELIESGDLTVAEAKEEFMEYGKKNAESFESKDEESFIEKVWLFGKAVGADPIEAFQLLFSGEKIRKIENGAIIVERMPFEESEAIRKERGATEELILDHTIPLQLGGANDEKNLQLVSLEEWERYTVVENYLGDKLRAGLIDKKEARTLIRRFKEGRLTEEDIIK